MSHPNPNSITNRRSTRQTWTPEEARRLRDEEYKALRIRQLGDHLQQMLRTYDNYTRVGFMRSYRMHLKELDEINEREADYWFWELDNFLTRLRTSILVGDMHTWGGI